MTRTRPLRTTRALGGVAAALLLALTVSACSSSGDSGGDASSSADYDQAAPSEAAAPEAAAPEVADAGGGTTSRQQNEPVAAQPNRSLIRTGTVALRSEDVARARFDVQKVVDAAGGEIGEETTSADEDGDAEFARLVIRVPSDEFTDTMAELEGVADLISTDTATDDVTTEVIDTDVRVRLQRRSIERIGLLLERAGSLRDIVRIEQDLARREADLASLEQQQAYFDDQTSFSTITVSLERPAEKEKKEKKDDDTDDAGFLSGLEAGWDGLTSATTAALTVVGAVLPFAVVLLVLGSPVLVLLRRRRRGVLPTPAPAPPAP